MQVAEYGHEYAYALASIPASAHAQQYAGKMLVGSVRLLEIREISVSGETLADVRQKLDAETPAGFELTSVKSTKRSGSVTLDTVGEFARRDQRRDIEADTMERLREKVPEGWQLLHVRRHGN